MKIHFILVASGSIVTPRVNHAIFYDDAERAKEDAKAVVASLSKAGHFTFDLYDVGGDEHKAIASYRVETPEPVVTIR